jgi:hypothetical protein
MAHILFRLDRISTAPMAIKPGSAFDDKISATAPIETNLKRSQIVLASRAPLAVDVENTSTVMSDRSPQGGWIERCPHFTHQKTALLWVHIEGGFCATNRSTAWRAIH